MRVAALYDIHGNLPALEAVLAELRESQVDRVVVGGDVVPGPMARECLERLLALDVPVQAIHGNCELAVLAQRAVRDPHAATYWGTTSGRPLPEPDLANMRWSAEQLSPELEKVLASWPKTARLEIEGLGDVLFCHGTPRSETEIFTRLTPEAQIRPLLEGLGASVVVCGHTHMAFERMVGRTRVVNAGSVGNPFGESGAHWVILGPHVERRRTLYDLQSAAERIRATGYPGANGFADQILEPASEDDMLALFEKAAVGANA